MNDRVIGRGFPGIAAAAIALLYGAAAGAADVTSSGTASDAETLDTVVVTARKRDESLAQVPISITAFTSQSSGGLQHSVLR